MKTSEAIEILERDLVDIIECSPDSDTAKAIQHAIEHMRRFQWQKIESAPKYERILMLMKHGAIEGTWDGDIGYGYYWTDIQWYPSGWMPLPDAPESEGL